MARLSAKSMVIEVKNMAGTRSFHWGTSLSRSTLSIMRKLAAMLL